MQGDSLTEFWRYVNLREIEIVQDIARQWLWCNVAREGSADFLRRIAQSQDMDGLDFSRLPESWISVEKGK